MRKFSLVVVAAMLLSVGNVLANDIDGKTPAKKLKAQISTLLADHNFKDSSWDATAQVRFTLNKEKEIVVLSVDSDNSRVADYVKQRLNYKKVNLAKVEEGKIYTIPVRIES